jgi:hypothetical protein
MAVTVSSVRPYWDLTFDADGDCDPAQRGALVAGARGLTDLLVFAHGWNNDLSTANALYDRFLAPFPTLLPAASADRFGFAGVHWPSMRFSDEPIPDFPHAVPAVRDPSGAGPGAAHRSGAGQARTGPGDARPAAADPSPLDAPTRAALAAVFPGTGTGARVDRIAALLAQRPHAQERLAEFAHLVRELTGVAAPAAAAAAVADPAYAREAARPQGAEDLAGVPAGAVPLLLCGDPAAACAALADALARAGAEVPPHDAAGGEAGGEALFGGLDTRVWDGAKELLRQATYYAMKRRAGTVGEHGLGPLLGELSGRAPRLRIHLVGHSFGARLVSFALRGLPPRAAVASVTLLQGAFSHYTFSGPLPFDAAGGALHGMQRRVTGPVVACHSGHDQALGVFYPVASRMAGEDRSLLGFGDRWGALGHDGFQSLDGATSLTLADAMAGPFPAGGCVSVDVSAVVRTGGPPSGAHSDICHEELARLVLRAAGRHGG